MKIACNHRLRHSSLACLRNLSMSEQTHKTSITPQASPLLGPFMQSGEYVGCLT